MAEAVIISIAEKIVANLAPRAIEQVGKLWCIKHELKALKNTVSTLQAVLDDAEEQYYESRQIQDCLQKLKGAFYDAEDVLEEFSIEATRRELRDHNEMMKKVRTFFSRSNQLAFTPKIRCKVKKVRRKIEAIKADMQLCLSLPKKERRKREETHGFIPKEDVIGREDDIKTIMKFLLDSNVKENVSILPIVGIGGLGKTALAKYVYEDSKFDLKMWVCVSTDFDVKKIMKKMLACAKEEEPSEDTMELLQRKLRAEIEGKKYLLVLDDLWNDELEKWLSLKNLLVGGARGSKILITTRRPLVAEITGTAQSLSLKGLSEGASLELLMQMAGRKIEEMQDSYMLAIGEEIVKKCAGVPLAVRIVGSLLRFKKTELEWSQFKDNELPVVFQSEENSIKSILKISYDYLPSRLKQCFAFCSLFPKDYEIEKQTLVDLWVAEGFIQPSNRSQHLEDIAHGYFMDLLWSNFFQDFKKDPYTNKETCKMHDLMHDLACMVAGTECWVAWDDTKLIHERTRHISHDSTPNLMGKLPISRLKASALRTFLSTTRYGETEQFIDSLCGSKEEPISEADLPKLIQSFKRLRILDLHARKITKVPRSICKMDHLKYLDLSHNGKIKRLPSAITRLHNLQTLNLNSCYALEELPKGIRKLVSLRNLDIDGCSKLRCVPRGLGQLSSLHRLTRFILPKDKALAKNYCGLGELNGLNNIRGSLCIENLGSVTDAVVESRAVNLIGKHSMKSLTLNWGSFDTEDAVTKVRDEALLDGLQPPSNLQELILDGYKGERSPRWMMDSLASSLPYLIELRLVDCKRCRRLPQLGQVPRLKTLVIWGLTELECIESDHSFISTTSFPSLLTLRVTGCEKLKTMPLAPRLEELSLSSVHPALINQIVGLNKLKTLDIRKMEFLECLPDEECLKSLTSLEFLRIQDCPQLASLAHCMRHLSSLVHLYIQGCDELDISKDGSGNILDFHGGLQNLRSVAISSFPKLEFLPRCLLEASNLERLLIFDMTELECIESDNSFTSTTSSFPSLLRLHITGCEKLKTMPLAPHLEELSLTTVHPALINQIVVGLNKLKSLHIGNIEFLECFPEEECLKSLTSLEFLRIQDCPRLAFLALGMRHLSSLVHLYIDGCDELDISKDGSGNILDFQGGLQNLRSVAISSLPKLEFLPRWLL